MRSAQFTLHQLSSVLRRRWYWILTPIVLVTGISVLGALLLPRKYESSITILVQKDEILNPLVSFTMAVQMASEDRLRTFNEIIYSRQTIESLLDSLGRRTGNETPAAWDELIDKTKASIRTDRSGSDSFTLIFVDTDPVRAQRSVTKLAEMFIETQARAESDRNDYTVRFFENKLNEYERKYGETQNSVVNLLRQRSQEMPGGSTSLSTRYDLTNERIREASERIHDRERLLATVALFPTAFRTERGREALSQLQAADIPTAADLKLLNAGYDSVTVRYTEKHPEVAKYEGRIMELLERTRVMLQSDVSVLAARLGDLQKSRDDLVQRMTESTISQTVDKAAESNFTFYQQLYADMRVKLEQARIARELGKKNAQKGFQVIDSARIPAKPTKPNRLLIVVGGFFQGIFLGVLSAAAAELLDTTIRSPREIEHYKKPIIALLPEGARQS